MILDPKFVEACDSGNKRLVRIKLGNIITIDPTLKTFREMRSYAEQRVTGLYDTNSGEPRKDRSLWTKDYYNEQQTELSFNFSRERLDLLCDIAQHIYGGAGGRVNAINEKREQERKANASASVGKGVVAGGGGGAVVGGIVAACTGKAIIGGVIIGGVIGAVVGAVIASIADSNGKPD
ncbi:MAG: hypothetical protein LBH58_05740 [Tannerellaceae bacterium]|jgi:hypothetical protein|nr:hypothetical protein [Tannerellaceae bacterium]